MRYITALDHVQVAMPVGGEAIARQFYGGVLGLAEIPKPAVLAVRGGVWFQCGAAQLHLGADPQFQAARKAHPAFTTSDFAGLLGSLAQAGVAVTEEESVNGRRRATVADPFGNRVELIAA
ncbi:VOC family protein [Massilia sp. PAMC28688]|uniref:VOC family protein n=1 Tax=Massilia sp. PAMC28688 TaxID=2861283 RepID=UPI001C62BEAD|nr:VOC family protein [Massilia sp. PAMC28688]QYF95146.1 VOC family protein [Massilia sp. PAMC28688]